ncbi:MAG: XRE family transcriptional regulator [Deltaproteobacteria bacterium]|nr:XRE family transcriptional regulator [Deltaproteobacteria bacterium]
MPSKRKPKRLPSTTLPSASNATKRRDVLTGLNNRRPRIQVLRGSDNVFEDLGFEAQEAANLKVRADLMLDLRRYIQERGWTQAEAATFFGETQPRISNLLKGELSRFSIDKLINLLARAGLEVQVETKLKVA